MYKVVPLQIWASSLEQEIYAFCFVVSSSQVLTRQKVKQKKSFQKTPFLIFIPTIISNNCSTHLRCVFFLLLDLVVTTAEGNTLLTCLHTRNWMIIYAVPGIFCVPLFLKYTPYFVHLEVGMHFSNDSMSQFNCQCFLFQQHIKWWYVL